MPILSRKKKTSRLSHTDIDPDAVSVLRRLNKAGHIAYLVGGGVRDLLIGREPKDFDIATDARPRQIKRLFRNSFLIGRRFRLALIRFGDKQIETATFRGSPETEDSETTNPHAPGALYQEADNQFGTPEEDAQRRDFTVNALFYSLDSDQIIDYTGGLRDIQKRVLRSIGDPNIRFREDPVRMLRAVRLSARLDFTIHPESARAISRHAGEIMQASKPRLFEEITRLFTYSKAEAAFTSLWKTGLMREILPAIDAYIGETGGKKSDLWRFLAALDATEPPPENLPKRSPHTILENPLRMAVLLAPLFFSRCRQDDKTGSIHVADTAEQLVNDILVRPYATPSWRIPRYMCQDTINILESAAVFKSPTVKRTRYFRHPWFNTALCFWRICATARGDKTAPPVIDSWADAYETYVTEHRSRVRRTKADDDSEIPDETDKTVRDSLFPPKKSSRRRSGHRRHRPGRTHTAQTQETSTESSRQKST